jgi:3',5'-cyclic-AMP phosphodiesterase
MMCLPCWRSRWRAARSFVQGNWVFLFLNSVIPGENGGELSQGELEFLDQELGRFADKHALVCLHHNPVSVGSAWLDTMMLASPDAFFAVIDRHPHVCGILSGHVHQEFETRRGEVRIMATPSTSIQFLPKSGPFALDPTPPGYRILDLHDDGKIKTAVHRLSTYEYTPDLSTKGY